MFTFKLVDLLTHLSCLDFKEKSCD